MRSLPLGPALVAEAIGTFTLVLAGCGAIAIGTLGPAGVAAAFGLAIMTMVYALGHISGAHFNPRGHCSLRGRPPLPGRSRPALLGRPGRRCHRWRGAPASHPR